MDLTVSRAIGRNLQAFFGIQNLFDQVYFVQTNPSTIGTPRLVNGGAPRSLERTLDRDHAGWLASKLLTRA